MGPKKRRGKKQSVEDRTVASGTTEAATLVSGDYEASEVQTAPEVEGEEHVAQVLPPVASDRKLSSAVLVLENCLLTSSQPQPRNSLASPSAADEVEQPSRPGRKRKSLGIRKGVARKALTEEGCKAVLHGNSEELLKPKQRVRKKQKREVVRRVPRRRANVESSVVATVVVDEPNSDVDVESGAVTGSGDLCVETEQVQMEKSPTDEEKASGTEAFLEKRKRKKTFKKEKHATKRRRKDDVVIAKQDEEQEQEEVKVDDEEDDENEGENYATWMVSPLSGDEERMIFKRQRRVLSPDSEAGGIPGQCLASVPADAVTDFIGNVPDSKLPVDAVFVDPIEGDVQEDIDVELICPKADEVANTNFTVLTARKGRRIKKKTDSKTSSQSVDQLELEIRVAGGDAVNSGGRGGQKRRRLARKHLGLQEVDGSQDMVASLGSRVTRSRRNGNGGVTESRSLSTDKQSLGNQKMAEELSAGLHTEADSLEGPASLENSTDVNSLEEPSPQEIAGEHDEIASKAADSESKNRKKKRKKKKARAEERPNSAGSEEDRSSSETPKLDATSFRSSDADIDETMENVPRDVTCQPFDQGSLESTRDAGEATTSSNSDIGIVSSSKSSFSGTLSEKADVVPDQNKECPSLVIPALIIANDSTSSGVDWKDEESKANNTQSSIVNQQTPEGNEKGNSPSSGTRFVQLEQYAGECLNASQTNPGPRTVHSDSMSIPSYSTEEKSDNNTTTAAVSPLLSLECYSEMTSEAAAASDSDRDSVGTKPGELANIPTNTVAPQGNVSAVIATNGDLSKKEEGKLGEHDIEGVHRNIENPLSPSSSDAIAKDDCPVTNRKLDLGVGGGGSSDDTGFVPLKKRRLRMAETAAEAAAAEDGEKLVPGDAVMKASSDVQNPITLVPPNSAEKTTIDKTEGQPLGSPASVLLTSALPCTNLVPKANKYVGTHVLTPGDLAGAVLRGSQLGARALGIFIKLQRTWTPPPLDPQEATKFKEALKEKGYSPHMVVPHGSYLLNCGASDAEHLSKSRESLVDDLKRCQMLGLPLFNFHPGAYSDSDTIDDCVLRIADSINYAHSKVADVMTVIENMSGEANSVGSTFEQLKQIINGVVDKSRIGVCLDTCHAFAAGYDLRDEAGYRKLMEDFDSTIGREYLKAVHINDSQGDLGSRVDHHASIGKGKIGLTCFQLIMSDRSLENIPLILETPIAGHKQEIELLYSFISRND